MLPDVRERALAQAGTQSVRDGFDPGRRDEMSSLERAARIVEAVVTAAEGLGTSPLSVALAWVRDRPGVVAPIVGARDKSQLAGSLASESLTLPSAIRAALDDVSAIEFGYPERWLS